jgi:hypothetical protein
MEAAFPLHAPHKKGEGAVQGKGSRHLYHARSGRYYQPKRHTTMGYINDFRAKLTELIEDGRTEEAVKFAADKVLESYRNCADLIAKADPADVPRASASRGQRKTERLAKHTTHNVPPDRSGKGRHY